MSHLELIKHPRRNPIDIIEQFAAANDWPSERCNEDEVTIVRAGKWTDYQLSLTWMLNIEALHVACAFELKVPESVQPEIEELVSNINAELWVGHFGAWYKEGLVIYRHALMLTGGIEASTGQCEALLARAVEDCERFFPAFQFVVWAGKSAREAIDASATPAAR